jgi:hypothetical protein
MARSKESGTARYLILRDCGVGTAGETVVLDAETAETLVRDGMVAPAEEA